MSFVNLLFTLYFAAVFGISGFAKLQQPGQFAMTLRRQQILPSWSIIPVSWSLPGVEILVAILLVTGIDQRITAYVVLSLFIAFLAFEATLLLTKRFAECGCYGIAYQQKAGVTSVLTSIILVCFAALHLWVVERGVSDLSQWRLFFTILFGAMGGWIGWRVIRRRHLSIHAHSPQASRLQIDNAFPIDLGVSLPAQVVVLFVSKACPYCVDLCQKLAGMASPEWPLIILKQDSHLDQESGEIILPSYAQYIEDNEDTWFRTLDCQARPVAFALINGRLVSQQIAPTTTWFANPVASSNENRNVVSGPTPSLSGKV